MFLLNINAVLSSVRNLPSEVRKTTNQFSSWYYDDAEWSGHWTSIPEGYVDAPDMNLSPEKIAIELDVKNGVIDGMVATRQICDSVPFFDFLLLRGKVNTFSDSATVVVWDTFEGHDRDIAELQLKRDGIIMSVVPNEGLVSLFPPQARIARDPTTNSMPTPFCEGKQEAIAKALEQTVREKRTSSKRQ